jgi:WD40 repeat protein
VKSGNLIKNLACRSGSFYSVCFSEDDKKIISGNSDETIKIWDE